MSPKNVVPSQILCVKAREESTLKHAMYHSCARLEKNYLKMYHVIEETTLSVSIWEGNCMKGPVTDTEPFRSE